MRGRTSIKEMSELPNRYMHYYFYQNYKRGLAIEKDPNGPEAKALQGEQIGVALTGMV